MPTRSAICASSGEYTPPVKTYGSSLIRSRNVRPFDSNEQPSSGGEHERRRRHGTPAAIRLDVHLDGAGRAQHRAALLAPDRPVRFTSFAAALRIHVDVPVFLHRWLNRASELGSG